MDLFFVRLLMAGGIMANKRNKTLMYRGASCTPSNDWISLVGSARAASQVCDVLMLHVS